MRCYEWEEEGVLTRGRENSIRREALSDKKAGQESWAEVF